MISLGSRNDILPAATADRRPYAVCILCLGSMLAASAQKAPGVAPQPGVVIKSTHQPRKKSTSKARESKALKEEAPSLPLAGASAKPATVTLKNGNLTVEANNSDLRQILGNIAELSGMKITGSVESAQVYGVYGPLNPRDVLTELLGASGYNILMVGVTHDGAPRELVITRREGGASPPRPSSASEAARNADMHAPDPYQPGPGAIVNVPPPPPEDTEERVKRNLQRLTRMHEKGLTPPQ